MIQVYNIDTLVAEEQSSPTVSAIIRNKTKADAIILHITYVSGSESDISIVPTISDDYAIGEFKIQKLVNGSLQSIEFSLDADGQYTIPIPMSKSWELLKLTITFNGDTSSMGSIHITAIPDYALA